MKDIWLKLNIKDIISMEIEIHGGMDGKACFVKILIVNIFY